MVSERLRHSKAPFWAFYGILDLFWTIFGLFWSVYEGIGALTKNFIFLFFYQSTLLVRSYLLISKFFPSDHRGPFLATYIVIFDQNMVNFRSFGVSIWGVGALSKNIFLIFF